MNEAKVTDVDYISFLVASPCVFSCTEAARVQPATPHRAAHDAVTRLLQRLNPDPDRVRVQTAQRVVLDRAILIIDDTVLENPYAQQIALVGRMVGQTSNISASSPASTS